MALVVIKILKKFTNSKEKSVNVGDEIVMQRKPALALQIKKFVEVGRVLDPRKLTDKPLVDAYLGLEKAPKKSKK